MQPMLTEETDLGIHIITYHVLEHEIMFRNMKIMFRIFMFRMA